jgi:hypothetical protein
MALNGQRPGRFCGRVALLALFAIPFLVAPPAARAASSSSDGTWTHLQFGGPPPRRDAGAAYDLPRDRLVVVAGDGGTWAYGLDGGTGWVQLPVSPYASTGFERAIYDPVADRMILINSAMIVFELNLAFPSSWVQLAVSGVTPPPRSFFAVAHDAARNRLIVYGGGPYTGTFNDVWALNLTGPPVWSQISPTGTAPLPTWGPLAVYDGGRDRLIVGMGASDLNYTTNSDVFALNLSGPPSWTPLSPDGTPPPSRMLSSAVVDPPGGRMVLFSGYPTTAADTWALEFDPTLRWVQLSPTGGAPPYQWSSAAVYRSRIGEMVLYGGHNGGDFTDTWSLSLTAVTGPPIISGFSPPGGRVGDPVTIFGARLAGATDVTFNGVAGPVLSASAGQVQSQVPDGATTGPIRVTTPDGSVVSESSFVVGESPQLTSVEPDSGRTGDEVIVRGTHFTGATAVHLGGTGSAAFAVAADTVLTVTVDSLASTGPITVDSPVGPGTSVFVFTKIADDPRPRLLSVRDVAGDQGGKVMLRWRASDFDQVRYRRITGYRVWRRAPEGQVPAPGQSPSPGWIVTPRRAATTGDPIEFWESLAELPAAFLKGYAYAAATLRDSTDSGNPYTAFFVQAVTADPFVFYNSSPDSGYSVDNLAPPTPAPFTVVYGPSANTLHWHARAVTDLRGYEVYRGASATFEPSGANRMATTTDTNLVDVPGAIYYKLAAIDVHGNRSRYASAAPDRPVATLASFLRAHRSSSHVQVVWYSGGNAGMAANVYRRTEDSDWELQRQISADGSGYLSFDDRSVDDHVRYAYRLGVMEPGDEAETVLGETWVDALSTAFALLRAGANPSPGGRVSLSFSLPFATGADIGLYDVSGRLIERQRLEASGDAEHAIVFGAQTRLRPGLYLIKATSGQNVVFHRVVVLN